MELELIVFKESGKYYTSQVVKSDEDIFLFKDEFKQFISDNLPARVENGFVCVMDGEENDTFHIALFRISELPAPIKNK